MTYELRALSSKDIFPVSKIISKIGIKEFKNCFNSDTVKRLVQGKEEAEGIGLLIMVDIVGVILSNLPNCETEIYSFLSSMTGAKVKELEEMPMAEFAELITEIVQKEDFKDFFKVVSKLLKLTE